MIRLLSCLLAVAFVVLADAPGPAQEKPAAIQISWHGQSFFTIRSSKGTVVGLDPHLIPTYGRPSGLKADLVLTSHLHNDHTQIAAFDNYRDKDFKVINGLKGNMQRAEWNPVDEDFKDFHIRNVGAYHDASSGMERGRNSIFILEVDGWKIAHLGDLGHELTPAQAKKIGPIDVLMVPVGGVYTLNGSEAKKVVQQLQPKEYIFPMHHATKVFDDVLPADEFLEDQERAKIAVSKDNHMELNRDLNRPRPLIVQLHYWPKGKKVDD